MKLVDIKILDKNLSSLKSLVELRNSLRIEDDDYFDKVDEIDREISSIACNFIDFQDCYQNNPDLWIR